jgi:hypothetical protein
MTREEWTSAPRSGKRGGEFIEGHLHAARVAEERGSDQCRVEMAGQRGDCGRGNPAFGHTDASGAQKKKKLLKLLS